MQPLIKWPGGKTHEFPLIQKLIPPFERYFEPFFGGGAVFFQLKPKNAIINDYCTELTDFYTLLKPGDHNFLFQEELYSYADHWEKIPQLLTIHKKQLQTLYQHFKKDKLDKKQLAFQLSNMLENEHKFLTALFPPVFCLDLENLTRQLARNLLSKINRTKEIEKQRGEMTAGDLEKNLESAMRSGFYMHFRDVMNCKDKFHISHPKRIANFYFIREFCYGSMFRFNQKGHFNIPYGGIAYNDKNFRAKVNHLFSQEVKTLFSDVLIKNQDFESIFRQFEFSKNDFIFLDPPYDSDFSDYQQKDFLKADQERLANSLHKTKAQFILIIKNTPFILSLYQNRQGLKIARFDKTYLYNVRGRNERTTEHLLISNF